MFDKQQLIKIANFRMPFGKYSGTRLIHIPEEYYLWMRAKGWPAGELGELMSLCLEIKVEGLEKLIEPLVQYEPSERDDYPG
ncbi:DUF3820 family protein [Agaribacterium haliotis]|uniref:DUF3820 family protein n=1 Tax=Agaribacterium haliotis TaxID=2013869 RepID=UPI000BB596B7|nr:DUF3820 family protein [Agaribacterium haliotis]